MDKEPQPSAGADRDRRLGSKEGMGRPLLGAIEEGRKQPLELFKNYRTSREIIWLSSFCSSCKYFQVYGKRLRCEFNDARLVKPFFGKVLWNVLMKEDGTEEYVPMDIDWDRKRVDLDDRLVERSMDNINFGRPYPCFRI